MRLPKHVPSVVRLAAIARLRERREARAQDAVRVAHAELKRVGAEIEKLTSALDLLRAERQDLYSGLPESMPRSGLLELKRREHGCETRRITLSLTLAQGRQALENAMHELERTRQALIDARRDAEKIGHLRNMMRARTARIETIQLEADNDEYRQHR